MSPGIFGTTAPEVLRSDLKQMSVFFDVLLVAVDKGLQANFACLHARLALEV